MHNIPLKQLSSFSLKLTSISQLFLFCFVSLIFSAITSSDSYMASFLAGPTCPIATTPRVGIPTCQQKSFSINGGPLFFGLKHVPIIQFSKAANMSYTRSRCFKTTISCSAEPETLGIVQSTIANQLSIEVSTVTPETKFADLGADSLDTVEIMMALEEQFGVSIGEGGAENIVTVKDAADLIQKVQAASA